MSFLSKHKDALDFLGALPISPELIFLTNRVVQDPDFQKWSGSGSPEKHHYGDGGLLIHTYEVAHHCLALANSHFAIHHRKLNVDELLVAAVWHDFGKLCDYRRINGQWEKDPNHSRKIHHISRSALEFQRFSSRHTLPQTFDVDHVIHMILSHHGRREWGSPVSPATPEAWILHAADNLSARIDDHQIHIPS
jgi:3'-5' exoribonuclease